jgi:hypothetical protein
MRMYRSWRDGLVGVGVVWSLGHIFANRGASGIC